MTDAERKLWWHLRRLPMEQGHFRRQATIGHYFVDFACHEKRLVIEVDGSQHGETRGRARDAARTEFLASRGYRVLRFWNNEVLRETRGVMEAIYDVLSRGYESAPPTPTPTPSPPRARARGGRGAGTASDAAERKRAALRQG
jgi:very-short-patch-repair endonuclease